MRVLLLDNVQQGWRASISRWFRFPWLESPPYLRRNPSRDPSLGLSSGRGLFFWVRRQRPDAATFKIMIRVASLVSFNQPLVGRQAHSQRAAGKTKFTTHDQCEGLQGADVHSPRSKRRRSTSILRSWCATHALQHMTITAPDVDVFDVKTISCRIHVGQIKELKLPAR